MQNVPHRTYSFGDFTLDLTSGALLRAGGEVRLRPKAFELLKFLVENNGRLVTKEELFAAVWPDAFVTDDALVKRLKDLRTALDDEGQDLIKTVPRRGYIFTAAVKDAAATEHESQRPSSVASEPRRFGRNATLMAALVALALAIGAAYVYRRNQPSPNQGSPRAPIRSIAVLPLENLTDDPSNEYFSDGMTESLITALSRIGDLKVISRGSVFRFRGKDVDPQHAGKELGVAAVLEGSVRKGPDSVRVAVRLVSVDDGRVLWSRDTHERALGDIFALQDEIARDVVAELRLNLGGEGSQHVTRRYTENVAAYQAYWKGRYFWNQRTEASLEKSIEYFEQAVDADPSYALAYVGLAHANLVLKSLSLITPQQARAEVETALTKALAIDDTLGEAHTALAWMKFTYDREWPDAEREFRRAIELQPNDATTHQWYAEYLSAMGRFDESLEEIRRAHQLDPPSPIVNVIAAQIYFYARRYDEAIEQCRNTLELDPDFYIAHDYLGWAYLRKGMYEAALAAVQRAKEIEDTPLQVLEIAHAEAVAGNEERSREALREVLEDSEQDLARQHCYRIARIYAALMEPDAAFEWLERAFDEREENLVWLNVDPHLDNLRQDPRFKDFLRRAGFAESP